MKKLLCIVMVIFLGLTLNAEAHSHPPNHSKHNMVMFGEKEVYLSHIVYKVPHNFQVILKVNLSEDVFAKYIEAKRLAKTTQMIFLFDKMDISQIATANEVSGTIYSEDAEGNRTEVLSGVVIGKENFKILYFDELPLDLNRIAAAFRCTTHC